MKTDYAIAVELLLGTGIKYGSAKTYESLECTWQDEDPIPSQGSLDNVYSEYIAKKELKHSEYYKLSNKKWVLDQNKEQDLKEAVEGVYDQDASVDFQNEFVALSLAIEDAETEQEFLSNLFGQLKTKSKSNKDKKNELNNKSMTQLMKTYNQLTEVVDA